MASAATLRIAVPAILPTAVAAAGYFGYRAASHGDLRGWLVEFVTGPGRTSRILLVLFVLVNWKSMPLMWTVRVFNTFIYHHLRRRSRLPPRALFHYAVVPTRNNLLDSDYNIHKSNSTYFADLDVGRGHLISHLLSPAWTKLADNARTKLVRDKEGNVVPGGLGVGLGAVFCSFRREISLLQPYEIWSRVLTWDRKWFYVVSHFVMAGKVRPTGWDGRWTGKTRTRARDVKTGEDVHFEKFVLATAVSKYVYKMGRFTVHPAIVLEANELLPERPGEGWRGGETGVGTPDEIEIEEVDLDGDEWDWRRVELERRKGMEYAEHLAALDGVNALFDGGEDGALGTFHLG